MRMCPPGTSTFDKPSLALDCTSSRFADESDGEGLIEAYEASFLDYPGESPPSASNCSDGTVAAVGCVYGHDAGADHQATAAVVLGMMCLLPADVKLPACTRSTWKRSASGTTPPRLPPRTRCFLTSRIGVSLR